MMAETKILIKNDAIWILKILMLFVVMLFLKFFFSHHLATKSNGMAGYLAAPHDTDVLVVGSSIMRQGIDAELLEKMTGRKAFIVAYNGFKPEMMLTFLQHLFAEKQTTPSVLVLEAYPYNLLLNTRLADTRAFFDAPPSLKWEFYKLLQQQKKTLSMQQFFELWVTSGSEIILSYPINNPIVEKLSYRGSYRNKTIVPMTSYDSSVVEPMVLEDGMTSTNLWTIEAQEKAFLDIIQLCQRHQVRLIFLDPPVIDYLYERPIYSYAHQKMQSLLQNQRVISVRKKLDGKNASSFADQLHLSSQGREVYTKLVASEL